MYFTFGKYRGRFASDPEVDLGWLQWAATKCDSLDDWEKQEIREEIHRRERRSYSPPPPPPTNPRLPVGVTAETLLEVVQLARRAGAKQHHPDQGGDAECMRRINCACDYLEQQTRSLTGGATR